jgi:ferredoxin
LRLFPRVLSTVLFAFILSLAARQAEADVACAIEGDAYVLTWELPDQELVSLEIRVSSSEFGEETGTGALLATITPDPETGLLPESWELPASFVVIPEICIGCGICLPQCPVSAIELVEMKAIIDPEACIACGICATGCPVTAIFPLGDGLHYQVTATDPDGQIYLVGEL